MNNNLKKLLLCLKWDIDNIENLNDKRDYLSGRVADIQEQVKNCSIPFVSNWVAVTESMPEKYKDYLVVDSGDTIVGWLTDEEWTSETGVLTNVTHWCEIPKPPCC